MPGQAIPCQNCSWKTKGGYSGRPIVKSPMGMRAVFEECADDCITVSGCLSGYDCEGSVGFSALLCFEDSSYLARIFRWVIFMIWTHHCSIAYWLPSCLAKAPIFVLLSKYRRFSIQGPWQNRPHPKYLADATPTEKVQHLDQRDVGPKYCQEMDRHEILQRTTRSKGYVDDSDEFP